MLDNNQQLLTTGCVVELGPITGYNVDGTPIIGPVRDIGTITATPTPAFNNSLIELYDSRRGSRQLVSQRVIQSVESYEVQCANMSLESLGLIYGSPVSTYTQSSSAQTAVPHTVFPDSILWLTDTSKNRFYSIASVASIGSLVAGTDYIVTPELLRRGCVKILPGATGVSASGTSLNVTFTPAAISGNRVLLPATSLTQKVAATIYYPGDADDALMVRDGLEALITAPGIEFHDTDNFSTLKFGLSITANNSVPHPAGRFIKPLGALAPRTY